MNILKNIKTFNEKAKKTALADILATEQTIIKELISKETKILNQKLIKKLSYV